MVRAGRDAEVLKGLIAAGLDYRRATVWIRQCRVHNLYHPPRPCPRCGAMLRTNQAQQCFLCGATGTRGPHRLL